MSVIRAAGDKFSVSKRLNWRRETVFIFIISKDTPFQRTRPTRFMVNSHFTPNTARPLLKYSGTEESELIFRSNCKYFNSYIEFKTKC